jgi:hypothetical protein
MGLRHLLLLVALVLASAGCASRGGSESVGTTTSTPPATTASPFTLNGFTIAGPTIRTADGREALHEDDSAHVKFAVKNERDAPVSRFVTYIENGEVKDTQTIDLKPGESREFEKTIPSLRDLKTLRVEVRAGDQRANASATIEAWPRTGATVDVGPAKVRVERWLKDPLTNEILVNVTVERKPLPEGDYHLLRAHMLCASAAGNVTAHGEARPEVPEPGNVSMSDIRLPPCPDTIYGIDLTGDAAGTPFYARVLFVEPGWRPPQG